MTAAGLFRNTSSLVEFFALQTFSSIGLAGMSLYFRSIQKPYLLRMFVDCRAPIRCIEAFVPRSEIASIG
jgi:hypothetical protein